MPKNTLLRAAALLMVITVGSALYWLTLDQSDPCASPQADISAAIIAEGDDDQGGLANRAMIMRGACDERRKELQK
ncbi:MAG: hypothetical protein ACJA09_000144 [Alcanivorax sp.]|jgi:hypothetical protein